MNSYASAAPSGPALQNLLLCCKHAYQRKFLHIVRPFKKTKLLLVDDDASMVRLVTELVDMSFGQEDRFLRPDRPGTGERTHRDGTHRHPCDGSRNARHQRTEPVRSKTRNPLTQVLFLTGHSSPEALTDALEMGATDYLLKPIDQIELADLLEQAEKRVGVAAIPSGHSRHSRQAGCCNGSVRRSKNNLTRSRLLRPHSPRLGVFIVWRGYGCRPQTRSAARFCLVHMSEQNHTPDSPAQNSAGVKVIFESRGGSGRSGWYSAGHPKASPSHGWPEE